MNRFEQIKSQIKLDSIEQTLKQTCPPPHINTPHNSPTSPTAAIKYSLRLMGLVSSKARPDRYTLRLRIPQGQLTAAQAFTIAQLAEQYADGQMNLTSRCQLQIRNIKQMHLADFISQLIEAELISQQTLMDSVRNVMTHPLQGVTPFDLFDVSPVLAAIEKAIITKTHWRNLPRKLNLYISATTLPDPVSRIQDISLLPAVHPAARNTNTRLGKTDSITPSVYGFNFYIGGRASGQELHVSKSLNVFAPSELAADLLENLIDLYQEQGPRDRRTKARLSDWIDEQSLPDIRKSLQNKCHFKLTPEGQLQTPHPDQRINLFGIIDTNPKPNQPLDTRATIKTHQNASDQYKPTLGLYVPKSQLCAEQLKRLAEFAQHFGKSQLRLTAQQSVLIPNLSDEGMKIAHHATCTEQQKDCANRWLDGFVVNPSEFACNSLACSGLPHCGMSHIDTKTLQVQINHHLADVLKDEKNVPTISVSGCKAGCGRHAAADIGVVGRKVMVEGVSIEAADIYVRGGVSDDGFVRTLEKVYEQVPLDEINAKIEGLVRRQMKLVGG
ncbi:Sulfite reductase [ferredoxin] [Poriferisphaera corsica]|uniref:Sulfite reductase [ferredoxin] n=1 Tax=Poriferisphaera corsica TaxID=2528020 RepID=A0A517YSL8_9BACT|nr:nitrite/sulfite reductase [Poriferisphaera corsica]QDU33230.1 Sulfite reductase [ferredoxin] [Poriferisphaera corsica]